MLDASDGGGADGVALVVEDGWAGSRFVGISRRLKLLNDVLKLVSDENGANFTMCFNIW